MSKKTIEQTYQKLSQREHVLERPGMYIGSVKKQTEELWVAKETENGIQMQKAIVEYSPGFIKIFDEVLTNATDHSFRDSTVTTIKVDYSKETGEISVWNNGNGIPIRLHKDYNMYVPELIFGNLLSGSNYDDSNIRTGAGTNGIGSKCHLHSTKIPLFNGEIKQASEINIGDVLIGDDGTPRKVLNKLEGYGEMYKVIQHYGEDYVVNNNHTLTLHMPDHKVIFWNTNGWSTMWWNNDKNCIETKFIKVFDKEKECPECENKLSSSLIRHYKRQHKYKEIPKFERKSPTYGDLTIPIVKEKYDEMEEFLNTIPYESVFDINIQDYLKLNDTTKRRMAGVRGDCVQFEEKNVELDPYILGLWLGDGMKHGRQYTCYSEKDPEIIDYFEDWCKKNDAIIEQKWYNKYTYGVHSKSKFGKKNSSPLRNILKKYNLIDNKHIPKEYLINSRENRLKLLAGLIDTDGTVSRDGTRIVISQSHIHKTLIDDIVYLVRSLGFFCCTNSFMAKYKLDNGEEKETLAYKVNISGNIDDIPTLLPRKKCRKTKKQNTDKSTGYLKIEKVNDDKYIGFQIDGNQRFVINDFTVTHNCTNIYSKHFVVETIDSNEKKKFIQEYSDNMTERTKPKITSNSGKSYTKITFLPDYSRFGMKGLEDDTILLLRKRVLDCIACTSSNVQVYLNGEKLRGKGLVDYTKYFFDSEKVISESHTEKIRNKNGEITEYVWEYAIVPYSQYEQVSFVNGNATTQGGKHVDYILYQIVNRLKKMLEEKKRLKELRPNFIKDKMFLFLRATIANPAFNSQTKEQLTTPSKDFGCSVTVTDQFITKLYKSSITDEIVEFCKLKETAELSKQDGKKRSKLFIPKLEDAQWAGTARSNECTLILTEGDSAKTFAMWGRSIIGTERYGIFPLKGKCNSEDTKIPLWNGEIKLAKDIKIGDIVIGDDGNPRNVLTLYKGNGKMYEISQDRGEPYKVNDEHILTLCIPEHKQIFWVPSNYTWRTIYWDKETKNIKAKEIKANIKIECKECRKHKNVKYTPYKLKEQNMNDSRVIEAHEKLEEFLLTIDDNNIIDISIGDYFNVTESFKRKLKGIRGECVNWEHQEVLLDPYVLGLWLGDGMKSGYSYTCYEKNDPEIMDYLHKWGKNNDAQFTKSSYGKYTYNISSIQNFRKMGEAPLKKILSEYNLIKNKHIPKEYLINSKEIRLQVLAGIIDTDGYIAPDGTIEISQTTKHKKLVDDIVYLSRSLGFYTYVSDKITNYYYKESGEKANAYRIKISGDTEIIPTLLPRKQSRSTNQYNMRNSTGTIQIKEINNENYVGIGIDGNNRFVINDFTVTHNCLNVRDATVQQLMNNEEINNLKQIIGLKSGKEYTNTNDLRYGKVMVLTDADVDGSHIKGLLVNFFHAQWPELLKLNFLQTLRTPIIKAVRGKTVIEFFTEQDYIKWKELNTNVSNYNIRYFKGLGTSQKDDAKDTFKRLEELKIDYFYKDSNCDESILLAFEKDKNISKSKKTDNEISCTDKRKAWLSHYNKNEYIDIKENSVSFQDLIHKELIHFSIYDNLRSIPSLCDGLKPSQRKILYYMLNKNINKSIKVAQLSGYVSAETSYHHGEASLQQAIIGMAQDFCGSNNLNLLYPDGNHGSRYAGGKDAASPRYIFTRLMDYTTNIFHPSDSAILKYQNDDGQVIEPEWYMPIIPMILVNGCEGIGTGYSTSIPPYNPQDIINNLLRVLDDKKTVSMKPYYRNFHGEIEEVSLGSYISKGTWKRTSPSTIEITEIPVGMWVTTYKEFLESLIEGNTKKKPNSMSLKDVKNLTTDENNAIKFVVQFHSQKDLDSLIKSENLTKELKLTKTFSTNNMYLFDDSLILQKYLNVEDILLDFYDIRLDMYIKRKAHLQHVLKNELIVLNSKVRFINEYINDQLQINKQTKQYIVSLLEEKKYPKHPEHKNYDYLIMMPIVSFSKEKIEELTKSRDKKAKELETLQNKSEKQLWKEDLIQLQKMLN
jgi:DNA gyrase/topoisomerase IV subunit B/ssDNA-binding Zn-finger/Zn-ribbon topoisomerase 1